MKAAQSVDWSESWMTPDGFREVSPEWTLAHAAEVRLVDVREPDELVSNLGAIAEIENVPMGHLARVAASWPREEPVVLVCRSGGRSGRMALQLQAMGFKEVASMAGGMLRWGADSLPLGRG